MPNRLIQAKSPYLLQHAYNPVDWYPWGEAAFLKAAKEDKPIFLSIGYSTCHWCHVMERESFSSPEIAQLMNQHFVSIKVDREEHPHVDQLYMQAVMAMSGQGGWPATLFLTPDLKPFYGGTYFPPEDRWGRPGLKTILKSIAQAWATRRQELIASGEELANALKAEADRQAVSAVILTESILTEAYRQFLSLYDPQFGGFGSAPKFPRAHSLSFLLRAWKRTKDPEALEVVEQTLKAMAAGGIYDHLGGGFHRYSTDAQWRVPHFEKMLYDQAILARAYLEGYQATGNPAYAFAAREIFEYVLSQTTDSGGGFYSAEDADSPIDPASVPGTPGARHRSEEGAFYLWTEEELKGLLGQQRAKLFGFLYGVSPNGNALSDPTGEFKGKNILYQAHTEAEAARAFGIPESEVRQSVKQSKAILFEARAKRPRPHLDDKILVDWNGLMISSLAFGSRVLEEPRYGQAAAKAAEFILTHLVREDGRLLHLYRQGAGEVLGTLEDYAFFIQGLIDLYEASFEARYLAEAKRLTGQMLRLFWDEAGGGFFLVGEDAEKLIARQKELYDGAIPSGNSVAALGLLRVGRLTMDRDFQAKAEELIRSFSDQVSRNPEAYPLALQAFDFLLGPSYEVVLAGSPEAPDTQAMVRTLYSVFLPNKVVAFHPSGPGTQSAEAAQAIETLVPFLKEQTALEGKATVYVCQNYTCDLPVTQVEQLKKRLTP